MTPNNNDQHHVSHVKRVIAEHGSLDSPQQQHLLASPSSIHSAGSFSITYESAGRTNAPWRERFTDEVTRLTKLSVPLFIQNLLAYSTTLVAVAFVGHLNHPELLSSAVLANSLYNVTGYSLLQGLASGMESLCGQAYGGRSFKTLGLVLQRALLINWAMCIPITLLWTHSEKLLLLLGQQPGIAAGAALYLRLITPTLYTGAVVECLKRYLLAQRVVVPGMVVTIVTCLLSPLYNWLFIFRLHMGLAGAALAFTCSQGTSALLLVLYTVVRDARMAAAGHEEATWCRPSCAMFAGWGAYLSYGLPATIQLCTEWWMYEVVIFMAGMLHNAEIGQGVMGLLFQISACAYMSALAYGSSVNTRVGNELGAGNAEGAKLAVFTSVLLVALVQSVLAIACKLADNQVVGVLTNNKEVEALTILTLPVLLPTFVFDALNCVAQGILRGAGRPGIGAVLNSVGYWGLGVPLAAYFGLHLGWSVKGFWAALLTTSATMSVVQLAVIARFDWGKEVARAAALMEQHDEQTADGKAADLAAAVGGHRGGPGGPVGPVIIQAVSSSYDSLPAAGGSWESENETGPRVSVGSQDEESDTAPLLDASGGAGSAGGAEKQASRYSIHSGSGRQPRGSDQGSQQPSRLARISQSDQQRQDRGSLDGQLARAWLRWPFSGRSGTGEQQQQQQGRADGAGQVAGSPARQRHMQQQGSLTRNLLREHLQSEDA